jgi:hypothetical protein
MAIILDSGTLPSREDSIDRQSEKLLGVIASGAATVEDMIKFRELAVMRSNLMVRAPLYRKPNV